MTDLSIIIVNWKSAEYLRVCLASIYRHTEKISFEVIVIDNASGDDCEIMLRAAFPKARLIASRENLGFARANNLGFASSSGEILLFLNPDTEVSYDVFSEMVSWMRAHPEAGAAGVRLLNTDGSLQESCVQSFPTILNQVLDSALLRRLFPAWKLWGTQVLHEPRMLPAAVDAISGACFMVPRCAFEAAGRFTESYFMYSDDLDLSYKIRRSGYMVVCLPALKLLHHGAKSSAKQTEHFVTIMQRESIRQFLRTNRGRFYSGIYQGLTNLSALLRLAISLCLLPFMGWLHRDEPRFATFNKWLAVFLWSVGIHSTLRFTGSRTHA
jgi:N-acetylglucosaminyl-diphospho-decaprenol L-rhamnosyltransferase